jgi:hypothetical protein
MVGLDCSPPEKGYATPEGLTLRYRFRLVGYGTDSPD